MLRKKVLRCMCSHSFTVVLLCPCICPLWWVLGAQTCPVLYSRVLASSHCNAEVYVLAPVFCTTWKPHLEQGD
eukprot:scaffold157663_cov17-Tisochrysis_lutea.AAC.1